MPDAQNLSLLSRLRARKRRVVRREPDPAEMGTAFGLEYTLDDGGPDAGDARRAIAQRTAAWLRQWMADRAR